MNFGVDFDGVLFDTESINRSYATIYNADFVGNEEKFPDELRNCKRFQWSKEHEYQFINKYLFDIMKTAPVMANAKEVISLLRKAGHKVYAITARGGEFPQAKKISEKRLKQEKVVFDGVFYNVEHKLEHCKQLKIDFMIDDLYDTIEILSNNGINCLYFNSLSLKPCKNKNIEEVKTWGDIYVLLKKKKII